MTFALAFLFLIYLPWVNTCLKQSVLNVKVQVGAYNQEKDLVGAFSVIAKSSGTLV